MAVTADGSFYNPKNQFYLTKENSEKILNNNKNDNKNDNKNENNICDKKSENYHYGQKDKKETSHEIINKTKDYSFNYKNNNDIYIFKENNLKKFENKILENDIIGLNHEYLKTKPIKTPGEYKPIRTDFDLNNETDSKKLFQNQNNCGKEYDRLIKTSEVSRNIGKVPLSRIINQRMQKSDIFFCENKNPNSSSNHSNNVSQTITLTSFHKSDFLNSDIFALKSNQISHKKTGEKHLLLENKYEKGGYYPGGNSNSAWSPKTQIKSLINHNSSGYDIINPCLKNNVHSIKQIDFEVNNINPFHRQKGLTEFLDLTRNFIPNYNKNFLNAISKDQKLFSKNQNLCANYLNLHGEYKNICDRPYIKKFY